jgi:thiamine biosynthesis lipoprotein
MEFRRSTFEAIGTVWEISVRDTMDDEAWIELMQKIYLRMQSFDRAFSRFRSDSLVTHIAHNPGTYDLPCEGVKMIRFYEALYEVTYGKVTPLIGETMTDAGYDASYSFKKKMLKTPPKWEDVLSYDHTSVTVTSPVMLDFGAAGKGYLVDLVARPAKLHRERRRRHPSPEFRKHEARSRPRKSARYHAGYRHR